MTTSRDLDRPPAAPVQVNRRSWLTLLAVALGIMVIQLDGTIVSVANPAIAADLEAGPAQIQWVTTAYLLVFAGLLIPAGTVADRLGHGGRHGPGDAAADGDLHRRLTPGRMDDRARR